MLCAELHGASAMCHDAMRLRVKEHDTRCSEAGCHEVAASVCLEGGASLRLGGGCLPFLVLFGLVTRVYLARAVAVGLFGVARWSLTLFV